MARMCPSGRTRMAPSAPSPITVAKSVLHAKSSPCNRSVTGTGDPSNAWHQAVPGDRKSNHPSPDIVPARAQISSLQPPSKPAFCLRRHDHWADHWASPGPDAALTRPFGATGSATSTARPTARSRRRPVCPLTNRCVDRARHRVLPGLTRPSPGRLAPPARHHLHPVRHTRPKAAARAPGRWAAPARPRRCAPGSA